MKKTVHISVFMILGLLLSSAPSVHASNQTVAEEINSFLENNEDMKMRSSITDPTIVSFLDLIQRSKIIAQEDSILKYMLDYFFYNIFPGGVLADNFHGLVHLEAEKAPMLHAMLQELAGKYNMPMPVIFLAEQEDLFNAFASSVSHNTAMIILGKKLVNVLSDDALRAVLAHELAHIKNNHVPKITAIRLGGVGALITAYFLFSWYLRKKSEPQLSPEIISAIADAQPEWSYRKRFCVSLGGCAIGVGVLYALNNYLEKISQAHEKEADFDALSIIDNNESFINAMQNFEQYYLEDIDKLQIAHEYVSKKLADLAEVSPGVANNIKVLVDAHINGRIAVYQNAINDECGTHPSLKTRIAYARVGDASELQQQLA